MILMLGRYFSQFLRRDIHVGEIQSLCGQTEFVKSDPHNQIWFRSALGQIR